MMIQVWVLPGSSQRIAGEGWLNSSWCYGYLGLAAGKDGMKQVLCRHK